ncbi:hypothetical protein A2U01_0114450, partial [Trifolium medium]|nr:hypothetical protein [Trifolium medium]
QNFDDTGRRPMTAEDRRNGDRVLNRTLTMELESSPSLFLLYCVVVDRLFFSSWSVGGGDGGGGVQ